MRAGRFLSHPLSLLVVNSTLNKYEFVRELARYKIRDFFLFSLVAHPRLARNAINRSQFREIVSRCAKRARTSLARDSRSRDIEKTPTGDADFCGANFFFPPVRAHLFEAREKERELGLFLHCCKILVKVILKKITFILL